MTVSGKDRFRGGSSSAYSPLMRKPNGARSMNVRVMLAIVLSLLCPPLGLLYMWKASVFKMQGRVLITAISAVEMAVLFVWLMPSESLSAIVPAPTSPQQITAVSEENVVTALSNMDELLGTAPMDSGQSSDDVQDQQDDAAEALLNTTVYSVVNGAKNYHTSGTCGSQTNRRELTIREALAENLTACSSCNPPSPQ